MRGQVLGVDKTSGDGQIAGDDGLRYAFRPDDWRDARGPAVGTQVDFTTEGSRAAQIFRLPDAHGALAVPGSPPTHSHADKSHVVAALLAFFFGVFGLHKFYIGKTKAGLITFLCGTIGWMLVLPGLFVALAALVESIIYLLTDDETFNRRYVDGDRDWF